MFGYKAADETPNFACCTGIQLITEGHKLVALLVIDPDNKLTVLGSALLLATHKTPQANRVG